MPSVAWLALALGLAVTTTAYYAYVINRYERGRKIPMHFGSFPQMPYKRFRIPRRAMVVYSVLGLLTFVPYLVFVQMHFDAVRADQSQPVGEVFVPFFAPLFLLASQLVIWLHNRKAVAWPTSGWYDDPTDQTLMRWWNAVEWTEFTFPKERYSPMPYPVPPASPTP